MNQSFSSYFDYETALIYVGMHSYELRSLYLRFMSFRHAVTEITLLQLLAPGSSQNP